MSLQGLFGITQIIQHILQSKSQKSTLKIRDSFLIADIKIVSS